MRLILDQRHVCMCARLCVFRRCASSDAKLEKYCIVYSNVR